MRPLAAVVAPCLLLSIAFAAAPPAKAPAEWLKLIDQLGDDDAAVREAATKKLDALGEDVIGPLRAAAKTHGDVDVRLRAAVLADAIDRKAYGVVRRLVGHTAPVINFALSPDGKQAVSSSNGDKDGFVRVWDVGTGKELFSLKGLDKGVYAVAWSEDGKRLMTAGGDKTLRLWEAKAGKEIKSIPLTHPFVYQVAFTPKGDRAVSCGTDQKVCTWDLDSGKEVAANEDNQGQVRGLAMVPDGKAFVTAGFDGGVRLIEVETGKMVRKMDGTHVGGARFVAVTRDGKRIASCGADGLVKLHDAATGKELKVFRGHGQGGCHGVAISADGKRILSAGYDHTARLWDVESGKQIQSMEDHGGPVSQVAFLPAGKHAVTSSFDKVLRVWKLRR